MRIKKAGILIIAAAITCTTPAVPAMAADTSESVQEIISDNEIVLRGQKAKDRPIITDRTYIYKRNSFR